MKLSLSSSHFLTDQFDFQENQNQNINKNSKLPLATVCRRKRTTVNSFHLRGVQKREQDCMSSR